MGWIVLICSCLGWCTEVAFAGRSFVLRRITAAYPQLQEGRHNGRNFRRLKEHFDANKDEESA